MHFRIDSTKYPERFGPLHRLSSSKPGPQLRLNMPVEIYALKPHPPRWRRGKVSQVDGSQVQVTHYDDDQPPKMFQYWFSIHLDDIRIP